MKIRKSFFLFIFLITASVFSNSLNEGSLDNVLDNVLDNAIENGIPGIIIQIDSPKLNYLKSCGYAERKTKLPMNEKYLLRCASLCKMYISTLVIMLEEEEKLHLSDPLNKYLNQSMIGTIANANSATILQALIHTSGIPDYYDTKFYLTHNQKLCMTSEKVLSRVSKKKATNSPGKSYHYSNTNYVLLGLIVEKLEGKPLRECLNDRIFKPLHLKNTYYNLDLHALDQIHGYGTPLSRMKDTFDWKENYGADGGIKSTAQDITTFLKALFNEDGKFHKIGLRMQSERVDYSSRKAYGLGIEFFNSSTGINLIGHSGDNYGYLTLGLYIPKDSTSIVIHINRWKPESLFSILGQILKLM